MNSNRIFAILGIIILLIIIIVVWSRQDGVPGPDGNGNGTTTPTPTTTPPVTITGERVVVADQAPGIRVVVSSVAVRQPSFVVIFRDAPVGRGELIGTSGLLGPGTPLNIPINLPITLTERVEAGDDLVAVLYADNGNGLFSLTSDTEVRNDDDDVIEDEFEIRSATSTGATST
jgi:hypothetical protein